MMNSHFHPSALLLLAFLFCAAEEQILGKDCDTQAASDCMKYSDRFRDVTLEDQHAECDNATKTVECLEDLIARCPSLAQEDEMLHTMITRHVALFKEEAVIVCAAASTSCQWTSVLTLFPMLTLLLFLHFVIIH